MRRLLLLIPAALLLGAPVAHAHGDPASSVLETQWVFVPFEAPFAKQATADLLATATAARKAGYPIKVALITASYDLGTDPELFGKPQVYADHLGLDLSFRYTQRVLVVMPQGLGIYHARKSIGREQSVLKSIQIGKGPDGLAAAATEAIRKLTADAGIRLPSVGVPAKKSSSGDRLVIILVAAGGLALVAAAWLWRRRR